MTQDCKNAPKPKTDASTGRPGPSRSSRRRRSRPPPGGQAPQQAPPGAARAAAAGAADPQPGAARTRARPRGGARRDQARPSAASTTLTRRLRAECPWDREQDERTIVPHTVEEAYELADAANRGDDAKLLDELGDVLFQVHFLSLLLEERGAGDLAPGRRALPPEAHPPPSPRLRRRRGRDRRRGPRQLGRDQDGLSRDVRAASSARCPRTCPGRCTRARSASRRARSAGIEDPERGDCDALGRTARSDFDCGRRAALRVRRARRGASRSTRSSRCAPRHDRFRAAHE